MSIPTREIMPGDPLTIFATPSKTEKGLCQPGSAELFHGFPWERKQEDGKIPVFTTAVGGYHKSKVDGLECAVMGGCFLEYEIAPGKLAKGCQEGRMAMRIVKEAQLPPADHALLMQTLMSNCLHLLKKYHPDFASSITHVANMPSKQPCATQAMHAMSNLTGTPTLANPTYKISNLMVAKQIKSPEFYDQFPWKKRSRKRYSHEQLIHFALNESPAFLQTKLSFYEHAYCAFQKFAHSKIKDPHKAFSRQEFDISPLFRDWHNLEIFKARPNLLKAREAGLMHVISTEDDLRSAWSLYEQAPLYVHNTSFKHKHALCCCVDGRPGAGKGAKKVLQKYYNQCVALSFKVFDLATNPKSRAFRTVKTPKIIPKTVEIKVASPKSTNSTQFPPTLDDLKDMLKKHNIRTSEEYFKRFKALGNLPCSPAAYYKDWDTWSCVLACNLPRSLWAAGWSQNLEKYKNKPETADAMAWIQLQQERLRLSKLDAEREEKLIAAFPNLL